MLRLENVSKTFFAGTVNEKKALTGLIFTWRPVILSRSSEVTERKVNVAECYRRSAEKRRRDVAINGENVTALTEHERARYIGRVFQDPMAGTSPSMTIEENLALAYRRGKKRTLKLGVTKAKRDFFREHLSILELGLEDRLKAKVGLLSGGQRQALSLLMATFTQPEILLLDEHTAALDPKRGR